MAFKIKLSHQRKPRGLHALVDRAENAERQTAEMRRALAETERDGVRLRAEKDRAAAHLARCINEHERVEAESELTFYDVQTATEKVAKLDAENSAAVDHAGELVAGLHSELDQLESDLDQFIKKGDK